MITKDKEQIIKMAELNISDLKRRKCLRIIQCLSISAGIVACVAIAKLCGLDKDSLKTISHLAMAINSGIMGITVKKITIAHFAVKTAREGLQKFENGEYDIKEYCHEYLEGAVQYAHKTMEQMERRVNSTTCLH